MGGRWGTRYQARELLVVIILHSSAASREHLESVPPSAGHSPPPETARPPISKPGMGRSATPMEGARATDAREILVVAILHSYAVSQGGHAPQADFIRLADRCLGAYGTAARRLPGAPVGDTPICVGFRGDATGKARQWTERPRTTHRTTLQNGHSGKSSKQFPEAN